jgi:hypothetical protein
MLCNGSLWDPHNVASRTQVVWVRERGPVPCLKYLNEVSTLYARPMTQRTAENRIDAPRNTLAEDVLERDGKTQELPVRSEFINAVSVTDANWDDSAIAAHANMLLHPPCMSLLFMTTADLVASQRSR